MYASIKENMNGLCSRLMSLHRALKLLGMAERCLVVYLPLEAKSSQGFCHDESWQRDLNWL